MGIARNTFVAAVASAALAIGGKVPGLPGKFTYGVSPFRDGTAYYLDAGNSRLYHDENGTPTCSYLGDLVFPAMYDARMDAHFCPAITIRHISTVRIHRTGGVCRGMVCGYDIAVPGGGAMLTTDLVEYCPDIIATVYRDGTMTVVAAKNFSGAEDASPYFRRGKLIDMSLDTEPFLVDKCGGARYKRQLNYWLGSSLRPGDRNERVEYDDGSWDGL